jgi:two-component system phosphate regulon sensor histidine kinase PhoR
MDSEFKKWNINVAIPILLDANESIGLIVLGDKLSELRYSESDFELLNSIANSASLVLKKLELQEKIVQEQIEIEKLEELNQLKSFYVASVSHDFKTPLTSIKVFSELMQSEAEIPAEKKIEYLKIIVGETDRLTRLIDNVLDFTKIEKGIKHYSYYETDLNLILKDIVKAVEYILKMNKFEFSVKFTSDNMIIKGDSDAIKSALFNIITNSVKYSAHNKSISIETGNSNSSAYIEIEDKGVGIPDSDKELIFQPYFRSITNEIKGSGLGLTVVKHTMDAHKGKIELTSKINFGTKIRLMFPLSHQ